MTDLTGSDDYNLQGAWDTVCRSFAKTTMMDLTTTPRYTIDEVLNQIRQKQDDDEQRNVKYKAAKEVISKTLSCIEVLGGIAAQGASMVCISLIR
jgi:DNA-binding SARP family transcriptional activator